MCGICGKISNKIDEQVLSNMTDAMYRRGPNAKGTHIASVCGREIGMGHRRLSIFDLSEAANQPFVSISGNYLVVYNGEIYNFKEIRTELEQAGVAGFRTNSDTEVLLLAYMTWGIKALDRFNGMFAFAILDKEKGKLVLARDRMGVKPLYYSFQNDQFFFASDLAALMADPSFDKEIDRRALHYYLWNMYVPAPYSIFEGTNKLGAGEYIEVDIGSLRYERQKWWNIEQKYVEALRKRDRNTTENEWIDRIEKDIIKSVEYRLEADVPVGIFLSGGIDSSLVAAIASRLRHGEVNTFSIGFNEKEFDESVYASAIAEHLGTCHHNLYCSISDARELIKEIPDAYSEPFADNSQIPMMLLSKMTVDKVTVALSGDGGDELFLGYPNVLRLTRLFEKRQKSYAFRKLSAPLNNFFERQIFSHDFWIVNKFKNASSGLNIGELDYLTAKPLLNSLFNDEEIEAYTIEMPPFLNNRFISCDSTDEYAETVMLRDLLIGLPDDMLTKVDRATMHYALEARCPLLDCNLVEDSFQIPLDIKYNDSDLKHVLKSILFKYIPKELVDRPKQGFGIPINTWLHEPEFIDEYDKYYCREYISAQGVFSADGVENFYASFKKNNNAPMLDRVAWTFLLFQMWWDKYIKN